MELTPMLDQCVETVIVVGVEDRATSSSGNGVEIGPLKLLLLLERQHVATQHRRCGARRCLRLLFAHGGSMPQALDRRRHVGAGCIGGARPFDQQFPDVGMMSDK
ncbi:hypothetical protein BJF78_16990 [Pseudonocardia sp. CNS-139]|nr:hypothetical protein BJF78_16990 [Pseudonocardia sp. CNS-139]